MHLCKRGTIEDSYTLTHETIHNTNRDINNLTINWHLMTESFSILAELLQRDYFKSLANTPREYHFNELDTLYALLIKACQLDFELNLISKYMKYGQINGYFVSQCLEDKSDFYARWATPDILDSIKKGEFNFSELQRNVVGGVISSHMYERIKNKPSRISEFIELNDSVNDMEFNDTLHFLDLELSDKEKTILTPESVKTLTLAYKKRAGGVF